MSDTTKWLLGLFVFAVFGAAIVLGTAFMGCQGTEHRIEKGLPVRFHIEKDYEPFGGGPSTYIITDSFTGCQYGLAYASGTSMAVFKIKSSEKRCKE
jgi:hypothetical protein